MPLFCKERQDTSIPDNKLAEMDFQSAIFDFSLAHSEMMAFNTSIKLQEESEQSSDLAATTQGSSATIEETSASTEQTSAWMQEVDAREIGSINSINNLAELTTNTNLMLNSIVINETELIEKIKAIELESDIEITQENRGQVNEFPKIIDSIAKSAKQHTVGTENLAIDSGEIASSTDFSDSLKRDIERLNIIVQQHLKLSENQHVLSVLAARLREHADFLRKTIDSAGKNVRLATNHECAFGKWYEKEHSKYQNIPAYLAINEPHKEFHEAANALSQDCCSKNTEAVIETSLEIVDAFIKLSLVLK